MKNNIQNCTAEEALQKLIAGNREYLANNKNTGNVSGEIRLHTYNTGQKPYAIIVGCSDSRAIPEVIFNAGIGDLFVIRVAGNVIDRHQLGSIEYAADHLGVNLVVVLGHDHCGAVDAALNHDPDGHIGYLVEEIRTAIGTENDEYRACCLNARHSVRMIEENADIMHLEEERGLKIISAMYHLDSGKVDFTL